MDILRKAQPSYYSHFAGLSFFMLLTDTLRETPWSQKCSSEDVEILFTILYLLLINTTLLEVAEELSNEEIDYLSIVFLSRLFNYPAESPDQIQKRLDKLLLEASKNYKAGQKHSIDRNLKYVSSLCNTRITAKDIEELISKVLDEASDNDKTHLNFFKMCTSMKIEDKRMIEFLENTGY